MTRWEITFKLEATALIAAETPWAAQERLREMVKRMSVEQQSTDIRIRAISFGDIDRAEE